MPAACSRPVLSALGCLLVLALPAGSFASTPAEGPIPPSAVVSASLGARHACAITSTGTVRCWGDNAEGQLGDGTVTPRAAPVELPIFASQVVTGAAHTCVLSGGTVSCWGRNTRGQLGDGTTGSRATPAPVTGLGSTFVLSIAAGAEHTCAVISFGAIRCWGSNSRGQLGDGTTTDRSAPVAVPGTARSLAGGSEHTCARTFGDTVRCWGRNAEGQLGDNTTTDRLSPVDVLEGQVLGGVLTLSAGGFHNCVTDQFGGLKCWGANGNGQIGDGTTINRTMPTYPVQLGADMVAAAAGTYHSCGVNRSGTTLCWGFNTSGQLGDGTQTQRLEPVEMSGIGQGGSTVLAGDDFSCVLTRLDGLMCVGGNGTGQLGDGGFNGRTRPAGVAGLAGVATIKAGLRHNCVITPGGSLACWGDNNVGQLGDGTATARSMPGMLDGYNATVLTLGSNHACTAGLCWGDNGAGQFGDGTTTGSGIPAFQAQFANIADMAAGELSTCTLSALGAVKCSGNNSFGQLGDGTNTARLSPVTVSGLASGVAGLASGSYHACAVTQAGGVKCWGSGSSGELGNGGLSGSNVPVDVIGLASGVSSVAVGATFSCALTTAGGVKCWGTGNVVGGFGTTQATPIDIIGLANGVTAVSAGSQHACARLLTGEVKCWGRNDFGQVGDGTTTPRNAPVSVAGITTGAGIVAAGPEHTCVLMLSGTVQCWGRNLEGRLGDGTTTQRLTPVHAVTVLDVARTGGGTVVSVPPAISCGATCTANVPFGGLVRLIGIPTASTAFAGWSGGACFGTAPCDLTLYRPTTVGAGFQAVLVPRPDFDADARSDLLWANADGRVAVWLMNGLAPSSTAEILPAGTGFAVARMADFDGDGKADLLWQHADGRAAVWLMNGTIPSATQQILNAGSGWTAVATPDLDGDGKVDIVWQHTDGTIAAWLMNGTAMSSGSSLIGAGTGWSVTKTGDFDGDGKGDLVWTHADGRVAIWLMNGLVPSATNQILNAGSGWSVAHAADLDGDGKADIVWQHTDGSVAVWLMNGAAMASGSGILGAGSGWFVAKTADFDGDGKMDLLWQHPDGRAAIWLMNGLAPSATNQILNAGPWTAKRTGDLDGDGKADIVWENADGSVAVWLMNGAAMASGSGIIGPASGWSASGVSP